MLINFKLNEYSEALKLHPRTILRHLSGSPNPYWIPGHDVDIPIVEVTEVFGVDLKTLLKILKGRDSFLTQKEAIKFTGLKKATFRTRDYSAEIKMKKIVRYLYSKLVDQHMRYL
jgi:hypothetical protein